MKAFVIAGSICRMLTGRSDSLHIWLTEVALACAFGNMRTIWSAEKLRIGRRPL